MNIPYQSMDRLIRSGSYEEINMSPLQLPKFQNDIFTFANNSTPQKNKGTPTSKYNNALSKLLLSPPPPLTKIDFQSNQKTPFTSKTAHSSIFSNKSGDQSQSPSKKLNGKFIYLNQLVINGIQLKYFPIIDVPLEDLSINIIEPLENNHSIIVESIEDCRKEVTFRNTEISEERLELLKEKFEIDDSFFPPDQPKTLMGLIMGLFDKIKYLIHSIQLNFIMQKKKDINQNLVDTTGKYIKKINQIVEYFIFQIPEPINISSKKTVKMKRIFSKKKSLSTKKKQRPKQPKGKEPKPSKEDNLYTCLLCRRKFVSGCGLGGHMSRVHPHKSEQYKRKQKVREKRNEFREAILETKIKFCKKYGMDYLQMIQNSDTKKLVKEEISKRKKEYNEILKKVKGQKGLLY